MTKDAIFRLAAMTKPITAVAVLVLVEQGKIGINDPVSRFVPAFKNPKVATFAGNRREIIMVPASREITIRDCLTHTSGLDSGGPAAHETARLEPWTPGITLAARIPLFGLAPLDFQPGTDWAYSGNGGPDVLSSLIRGYNLSRVRRDFYRLISMPLTLINTQSTSSWRDSNVPRRPSNAAATS
jgi:CubicO group peptidase (beta-lactamase class C family)